MKRIAAIRRFIRRPLKQVREATTRNLQHAAKTWLTDDVYILEVHPYPTYETVTSTVDRSKLPEPGTAGRREVPAVQRAELPNGLKIILAERHSTPVVVFNLVLNAGYAD
jgi:zinc protease